jgi:LysM repeat protein
MRVWGLGALALIFAAFYGANAVHAQDDTSYQWPDEILFTWAEAVPNGQNYVYVGSIIHQYNICAEVLLKANQKILESWADSSALRDWINHSLYKHGLHALIFEPDDELILPPHDDCYKRYIIKQTGNQAVDLAAILNIEHQANVCYEDYYYEKRQANEDTLEILVRLASLPCYNENGQRLIYYAAGKELETPRYTDKTWIRLPFVDMETLPYCSGDLYRENPSLKNIIGNPGSDISSAGITVFIDNVQTCDKAVLKPGEWLDTISRQYNVCIEALNDVNFNRPLKSDSDSTIHVPIGAQPCYDANGQRLGHKDRLLYRLESKETILDVADKFHVCVDELIEANPFIYINSHGVHASTPPVLFIPETPPCPDSTIHHIVKGIENAESLGHLYNICPNRIDEVYPQYQDTTFPPGMYLTIPRRPKCLDSYKYWYSGYRYTHQYLIPYTCYREPLYFDKNYAGTQPPLSPDSNTDSGHCYRLDSTTPVLYKNEWLTIYYSRTTDSYYTIAQCYGVSLEALTQINSKNYPATVIRTGSVVIPTPHHDCELAHMTDEQYTNWFNLREPRLGQLDDKGIYTVDYADTLSSIGRRFGYLPSMIAAENHLEAPYWIYPYQELQMPRMPSLYDIGKSVLYVGGVGVGMIGFGLYRMRRRGKKKQKPAA